MVVMSMASSSIATFFIYSKSQSQSNFSNSFIHPKNIHIRNKPLISLSPQPPKLRFPLTCSHTPSSPQTTLSKFVSEKIAFLLIGSFIFTGFFNKRPAFAVALPSVVTQENNQIDEEEMYRKILEKDPKNIDALKVIVHQKIMKGKSREAEKFVKRLIDVEPNEVEWRLLLAICYETMGRFTMAKKLYTQLLDQRPLLHRALHGLAMVMHKNNEGPAIFEMLNKAQELASSENKVTEERNIRILTAQMLIVQGNLEEGLQKFQDLIDLNPRDFRPYLCQGIIYSLLDMKEEAAQQFETYRNLVPQEFPQRGFLDDITLAAKETSQVYSKKKKRKETSQVQFQKEFRDQ